MRRARMNAPTPLNSDHNESAAVITDSSIRVVPKLTTRQVASSRRLRSDPTDAEKWLWQHLCHNQMAGIKFRRQHPVGRYVVDFACLAKRLAIEVDGGQHAEMKLQDQQRDAFLVQQGFRVLRFWNNEVLGNIEGVMEKIWAAVSEK